jgi:hypothetical protein
VRSLHGSAWQALNQSLRQRNCPSLPAASRVGWGLERFDAVLWRRAM